MEYRQLIRHWIDRKTALRGRKLTLSEISSSTALHVSLVSNVLKERGDFSPDQIFRIAEFLDCSSEEQELLQLKRELERSADSKRKKALQLKIRDLEETQTQTAKRLQIPEADTQSRLETVYYLDPVHQLIHVGLGVPRFAEDPQLLRAQLGLDEARFEEGMKTLLALGLARQSGAGRFVKQDHARHLPEKSPLLRPHQGAVKVQSQQRLLALAPHQAKSVTVTFTADAASAAQIREELMLFLGKCQSILKKSRNENVHQLNIDLFPWTT